MTQIMFAMYAAWYQPSMLPKVLVVDDEPNSLNMLGITLRLEGYEVETAEHGEEAIDKGRRFRPEVLISDWKLRDTMDGIEVARTLQSELKDLVVIFFSGSPSDELRAQATGINLFQVLEKPLGLDEVVTAIYGAAQSLNGH